MESLERRGDHDVLSYGTYPNGAVYLHPYGLRYAPIQLWVNKSGRLMLYDNWSTWAAVAGHEGFARLARLLGQDHRGATEASLLFLAQRKVWEDVLTCARLVNDAAECVPDSVWSPVLRSRG